MIFLTGVEKKQTKKVQNGINEVKEYKRVLVFEPLSSTSEPCCSNHCAKEPSENVTNNSEIRKN